MSDKATKPARYPYGPLTQLICDLQKATHKRRLAADPEKVARKYGIPVERAKFYIDEAIRCDETWPIKEGRSDNESGMH